MKRLLYKRACHSLFLYSFRQLLCHFHLRVVAVLHIFQGDAYVTATAGYAGGYCFGIGVIESTS